MDYLIAEYRRLENNLMNAKNESTQDAIYARMQRIASEIFNYPR